MTNLVKVGKMPGTIKEVLVENGTSVREVLELAGLERDGYEVKVNSEIATEDTQVNGGDMVILTKMIKGNADMVKVGKMPGTIQEILIEDGTNVQQVLELAGLDRDGYEIKVNGGVAQLGDTVNAGDMVILTKMIKGNAGLVKVGKMPGTIQEILVEDGTSVATVLELAGLDKAGYEVKVNGSVADERTEVDEGDMVILTKMIKGNK